MSPVLVNPSRFTGAPAGPADPYGAAVYADGPAAYWRFADASADNVPDALWSDASGHGRTLQNSHASPLLKGASFLTGTPAGSGSYNEAAGARYAVAPNAAWQNTDVFTIEMFIRMSANGLSNMYAAKWTPTAGTQSWYLYFSSSDFKLRFACYSSGVATSIIASNSLANSTNHHVGATLNARAMRLVIDGASAGTATLPGDLDANTTPISVGGSATGTNNNDQGGAEVAFYPTALTTSQIAAHYALR